MVSLMIKIREKRPFTSTCYDRSSFNDSDLLNGKARNCRTGIISRYEILCLVVKGQNTFKSRNEAISMPRILIRDLSISLLANN